MGVQQLPLLDLVMHSNNLMDSLVVLFSCDCWNYLSGWQVAFCFGYLICMLVMDLLVGSLDVWYCTRSVRIGAQQLGGWKGSFLRFVVITPSYSQ